MGVTGSCNTVVNFTLQNVNGRALLWGCAELTGAGLGNAAVTGDLAYLGKAHACFKAYEETVAYVSREVFSFLYFFFRGQDGEV